MSDVPEVRIDPLSGQRVIIAPQRADRPGAALRFEPVAPPDPANDPFAAGHEDQTLPELYAIRPDGSAPDTPGWTVRAVPNRWPVLDPLSPEPEAEANRDLFWAGPARGEHEVIVNAPDPVSSLAALSAEQLVAAVEVWRERMRAHPGALCLHLVVNEGVTAGASQAHTHAQLFAFEFVPAGIARERERFRAHATRTMGANLLAELVQQEVRRRERIVAIDDEAVLMATYAARVPYQLMLAPRVPRMRFEEEGPTGAALLHEGLRRLTVALGATPPLNLWIRTAPSGADYFCWRIDVLPRLISSGGIELGAGIDVNPLAPEAAAAALREG